MSVVRHGSSEASGRLDSVRDAVDLANTQSSNASTVPTAAAGPAGNVDKVAPYPLQVDIDWMTTASDALDAPRD